MAVDPQDTPFQGPHLERLRLRKGLSRPDFAKKCRDAGFSISPQHLAALERNEHSPYPKTVHAFAVVIADLYEITLDEAFDRIGGVAA